MRERIGSMILWMALLVLLSGVLVAQERWVYRYDGPANAYDAAQSVAMGPDGNVYVAGWSYADMEGNYDFAVVSLSPSGEERWTYRYDGPINSWDRAYSITTGLDSSVYAAGYSIGYDLHEDFTVISLTDSGEQRWVYRSRGRQLSQDNGNSIIMGSDGNLYAAGCTYGDTSYYDFLLLSLTASGAERWVYQYNGPANSYDEAHWIVMAEDGNLYAAGRSFGGVSDYDFIVVSLTSSGAERWVYRYEGPAGSEDEAYSVVMGPDGNIYAAGFSIGGGTNQDLLVVSLTDSGQERWIYRSYFERQDVAYSIVVGLDGNLYVAGHSDRSLGRSFTVVSLTTSGLERWIYRYEGIEDNEDEAKSIIVGPDGTLYAAGCAAGGPSYANRDLVVLSLTESGAERWVYRYDGPGSDWDEAYSIVMGADGNLYVAGVSTCVTPWTAWDFTVVSLRTDVGVEEGSERTIESPVLQLSVSPIPSPSHVDISYSLPVTTEVRLSVYDTSGRLIRNLVNTRVESGSNAVFWDGRDSGGTKVAPGTYFVRIEAVGISASRKCIIL